MYSRYTVYHSGAPNASFRHHTVSTARSQYSQYRIKNRPDCIAALIHFILWKKMSKIYCPLPGELYRGCNTLFFVENFVEISITTNDPSTKLSPTLLKAFFSDLYTRDSKRIYLCVFSSIFGAFLAFLVEPFHK